MSFIPQSRKDKKLVENILKVSQDARNAKEKDPSIINATIGSYYNENGNLHVFNVVKNEFENVNYNNSLSYAAIDGSFSFREHVRKWVLTSKYTELFDYPYISVTPTPGGTGAIGMAIKTYLEPNDTVLLPNLMWPSYIQIANNHDVLYKTYKLYDENSNFNTDSLYEQIMNTKTNSGNILVVVNDPCHNPTGFSMSKNDYANLTTMLNKVEGKHIVLLMDVAYLDYGLNMGLDTRSYFTEFNKLNDNTQVLFAYSASKSFGIYGLRVGALMHLSKDSNERDLFKSATSYYARATWSNINHFGLNIITNTFDDYTKRHSFINELQEASLNLYERAMSLIKVLDKYNVPYAPYRSGFFLLLLIDIKDFDKLVAKESAYIVKFGDYYRVAISCIAKCETERLGTIIGTIYNEYK